jgi:cellulose 1,4-beta-cellobiosidase
VSATTAVVNATPSAPSGSDTTPPSSPTSLAGTPGLNSASLTWTASTDNVGVTGYKVYRGGVLVGSPVGTSFAESGLTNGVAYLYTVKATDAAGNLSGASNQVSVTPADTQAPTVPTGIMLTQVAATHSITVSWTASTDNVAVQKYRVYRNGTLVGQPTTTTYSDAGLGNGATYSYRIAAVDAAGNASAQSPAVSTYVS